MGEKLGTICEIDLQSALDAVNEAEAADLPLGFPRAGAGPPDLPSCPRSVIFDLRNMGSAAGPGAPWPAALFS